MRSDALLAFVPIGAPLSIVLNSGQNVSSGIIDLLGEGVSHAGILNSTRAAATSSALGMR